MRDWLIAFFVKDAENITDLAVRNSYGHLASLAGVIINLIICIAEIIVGFLANSIAIISDGIHNVADAGGAALAFLSFKMAAKKADKEHPYGHGRMEYLFSAGFAVLLLVIAIELFLHSFNKILNPELEDFSKWTIIVLLGSVCIKFWLHSFQKYIGNRIDSQMIKATALESLSDIWSMVAVMVGLLIGYFLHFSLDGYLGAFVSIMIARAGIMVLMTAVNSILGIRPTKERMEEISRFVESYEGIMGVHDLMIHNYGPGHEYATIHAEVNAKNSLYKTHNMIDKIEHDAEDALKLKLTIHMDPLMLDARTLQVTNKIEKVINAYNPSYKVNDIRVVGANENLNIIFEVVVPYSETRNLSDVQHSLEQLVEAIDESYRPVIGVRQHY